MREYHPPMDEEPVRKGQRCPVCKKGAIVQRTDEQHGRHLGCSTFNPRNPTGPGSDRTVWNTGGVRIVPGTSRMTLILMAVCSVLLFGVVFFVLTQVFS